MTSREPAQGDVLGGRYELADELGRGGMATVFRATDLRLQRQVAVKVFREGYADAVDPRRTASEMQLLAGVNHPAVVAVLDAANGTGPLSTYLVMELVEGENLGLLIARRGGPLPADLARRIVADVAGALEMLHAKGVVHRDVKPANILVPAVAETRADTVAGKLSDFGIAQMVDGARITAPESILGTAAYLSPEQVRGARLGPPSDVYALGLVLLEALTAERAFPGPAAEAAMARLSRRPAMPATASPALAGLLSRMTALDPAERPSAAEVADALSRMAGALTAPDATTTAPTPMRGVPVLTGPSMILGDATAPVRLPTGPAFDALLPAGAPAARRRFPTALAAVAVALGAAVTGLAISAAAGVSTPAAVNAAGPGTTGPVASAPLKAAQSGAPVSSTPPRITLATPHPTVTRATPRPTRSAPPSATPSATSGSAVPVEPVDPADPTAPISEPPSQPAPVSSAPVSDPAPAPSDTAAPPSDTPSPSDTSASAAASDTTSSGVAVVAQG